MQIVIRNARKLDRYSLRDRCGVSYCEETEDRYTWFLCEDVYDNHIGMFTIFKSACPSGAALVTLRGHAGLTEVTKFVPMPILQDMLKTLEHFESMRNEIYH